MIGHREEICGRRGRKKERDETFTYTFMIHFARLSTIFSIVWRIHGRIPYTYTYGTRLCLSLCVSGVRPVVYF